MTTLQTTLLVVDAVFWLAVIFVKAIRPLSSTLSQHELKRREASGDSEAAYEIRRVKLLPRLHGLKWLAETLAIFISITILFQVLKPVAAILLSLVMLLLTDILSRQVRVVRAAGQWLVGQEPTLLRRAERWRWLDLFRRSDAEQTFQVGSRDELVALIDQSGHDVVSRDEKSMLIAQLGFSHKKVADVMTPRSMIDSVDVKETVGPLLLDKLHRSGHSRFPVIDGDDDHVVGMLFLQELVGQRGAPDTVKKAMKPDVYYVGEGRDLEHALHAFLRSHHHLFIVVNEYRETVGVLSLEDVIETMIGRSIVDEFDEFDDLRAVAHTNPKANNVPKGKQDI
jgi:CBS domain containing-hemolysin-like protein